MKRMYILSVECKRLEILDESRDATTQEHPFYYSFPLCPILTSTPQTWRGLELHPTPIFKQTST